MKIWIHLNGVQQGPYSKEEIAAMNLPTSTPVWYEGLPRWIPACQAPALADIFDPALRNAAGEAETEADAVCVETEGTTVCAAESAGGTATAAYAARYTDRPRRPDTFLAWSIILTLCCCTPFSLAAIVTGAISNTRYNRGDYAGARRMSHATEWLVIIAITLGIVSLPISMIAML